MSSGVPHTSRPECQKRHFYWWLAKKTFCNMTKDGNALISDLFGTCLCSVLASFRKRTE